MQITADKNNKQNFENCLLYLTFILNVPSQPRIHFAIFSIILAKRMLLVSHKVVFIESEAVLLYVAMHEHARALGRKPDIFKC